MPTEHTLLLALFGLLALTVGLLALLIYLVLSDRHRRGAEDEQIHMAVRRAPRRRGGC